MESGLHYNVNREYDPATGRYVEADPIGLSAGTNIYSYVRANPSMRSDEFGLWSAEGHDLLIQFAFAGTLDQQDIEALKSNGRAFDKATQDVELSYMHSMRYKGQSIEGAISQRDEFINGSIIDVRNGSDYQTQLQTFAQLIHPMMDYYSPEHTDAFGNPIEFEWGLSAIHHGVKDGWWFSNESVSDILNSPEILEQVRSALQCAYKQAFGTQ